MPTVNKEVLADMMVVSAQKEIASAGDLLFIGPRLTGLHSITTKPLRSAAVIYENCAKSTQDEPTRTKLIQKAIEVVRELRDISRRCADNDQDLCASSETIVEAITTGYLAPKFHNWVADRYQIKAKKLEAMLR